MQSSPPKTVAIDCEMVGVGDGRQSILARVSVVDYNGVVLLDTFVAPTKPVIDYRTAVSGVRKKDMENGEKFLFKPERNFVLDLSTPKRPCFCRREARG